MSFSGTYIITVILLVVANGFFVASEFSLVAVRRSRVVALAAIGNRRAVILLDLLNHLNSYISATQLGITMASLALGWIGEPALARLMEAPLRGLVSDAVRHSISFTAAFTTITVLHIVLGELAPKTLALERAERVALAIALPLRLFHKLFHWPIRLLDWAGNRTVRLCGLRPSGTHASVYTVDELRQIIDVSQKSGTLEPDEQHLLHRVFEFSDSEVREVMMPRTRMVGLELSSPRDEVISIVLENMYSRYPVYRQTIEDIVGVVHGKDLLGQLVVGESFDLSSIMLPPVFVPEGKKVSSLLKQMQRSRNQMAFVVDEYGGLSGLVTTEDLIEELVGEIRDEHDAGEAVHFQRLADGSQMVDGLLSIFELADAVSVKMVDDVPYETVAGLILHELGRFPLSGESVVWHGCRLICEEVTPTSILTVRIVRLLPDDSAKSG
ncbi:MAG: HlyC/CorC family transporter [Desulfuromonadales bacterium]|nr:HlyC/CorC family transporter [Desulfuromonadales bacterium]